MLVQVLKERPLARRERHLPIVEGRPPGIAQLRPQDFFGPHSAGNARRQQEPEGSSRRGAVLAGHPTGELDEIGRQRPRQYRVRHRQPAGLQVRVLRQFHHHTQGSPVPEGNAQERSDLHPSLLGQQLVVEQATHGPRPRQRLHPGDLVHE